MIYRITRYSVRVRCVKYARVRTCASKITYVCVYSICVSFESLDDARVESFSQPRRSFLSPEFRTKFQTEVGRLLFLYTPEFLFNTVQDMLKETSVRKKTSSIHPYVSIILRLVTDRHRHLAVVSRG